MGTLRIFQQRIGEEGAGVLTGLLPSLEGLSGEAVGGGVGGAAGVEPDVAGHEVIRGRALPVAAEERAAVGDDDVVGKPEREVRLGP